ncbi:hypothetical protein F2Q70_00008389 [Brassica cretica]|uniref:Uncharacterized protein n=1 Tax=Brassica cretica TaxID=69181 RepID=A0A8S9M3N4_BRACR|nr:hypothetical protein F2Q70_00008389 [Brassica cretica]
MTLSLSIKRNDTCHHTIDFQLIHYIRFSPLKEKTKKNRGSSRDSSHQAIGCSDSSPSRRRRSLIGSRIACQAKHGGDILEDIRFSFSPIASARLHQDFDFV